MLASAKKDAIEGRDSVRRGWLVACACLLAVFVAAVVTSLGYSLSDALGPGPGFFPFWLSAIGAALTVGMLAEIARGRMQIDAGARILPDRSAAVQAGCVLIALIVAAAAFEPLGFRLTMLAFIGGLLPALGARSWIAIASCAVVGSFGVFHVFFYWLKVPLPIGVLGI
jgi:putative tricarboxylic transport membrane protein